MAVFCRYRSETGGWVCIRPVMGDLVVFGHGALHCVDAAASEGRLVLALFYGNPDTVRAH